MRRPHEVLACAAAKDHVWVHGPAATGMLESVLMSVATVTTKGQVDSVVWSVTEGHVDI